jgi:hypothetical protein
VPCAGAGREDNDPAVGAGRELEMDIFGEELEVEAVLVVGDMGWGTTSG